MCPCGKSGSPVPAEAAAEAAHSDTAATGQAKRVVVTPAEAADAVAADPELGQGSGVSAEASGTLPEAKAGDMRRVERFCGLWFAPLLSKRVRGVKVVRRLSCAHAAPHSGCLLMTLSPPWLCPAGCPHLGPASWCLRRVEHCVGHSTADTTKYVCRARVNTSAQSNGGDLTMLCLLWLVHRARGVAALRPHVHRAAGRVLNTVLLSG